MNIEKGSVHYESLSDKTKQSATDVKDTTVICKVLGNNVFCHLAAKLLIHTIKACTYCSDFPLPHFVIPTSNFKHLWHSSCLCQRGIEGKAAVSTTTPSIENAVSDENTLKSHFTETCQWIFLCHYCCQSTLQPINLFHIELSVDPVWYARYDSADYIHIMLNICVQQNKIKCQDDISNKLLSFQWKPFYQLISDVSCCKNFFQLQFTCNYWS